MHSSPDVPVQWNSLEIYPAWDLDEAVKQAYELTAINW